MDDRVERVYQMLKGRKRYPKGIVRLFVQVADRLGEVYDLRAVEEGDRVYANVIEILDEELKDEFLAWKLTKLPKERRRALLENGDRPKPDRYLESRVKNLVYTGRKVYRDHLAGLLVKYFGIPEAVAMWKAERVKKRVLQKYRRFLSPENLLRLSEEYRIPYPYLKLLVDERVITPDTTREELRTLGRVLRVLIKEGKVR